MNTESKNKFAEKYKFWKKKLQKSLALKILIIVSMITLGLELLVYTSISKDITSKYEGIDLMFTPEMCGNFEGSEINVVCNDFAMLQEIESVMTSRMWLFSLVFTLYWSLWVWDAIDQKLKVAKKLKLNFLYKKFIKN